MLQILQSPKRSVLLNSRNTFPPLKGLSISQAIGHINTVPAELERTRAFDMTRIIGSGLDLTKFSDEDYVYNPHMDVVFVRIGSRLYTWLGLTN